jgi:porphobilinogen synthase
VTDYDTHALDALRLHVGAQRPRRWRRTTVLRDLVRETTLSPDDFVYPLFVRPGTEVRAPIASMPGIDQLSVDALAREARELAALGIKAVLLFGIPAAKDPLGLESHAEDGIVQHAIRALKDARPELVVITDVCLCEYTDHGHCGLLDAEGHVLNDETLEVLGRIAVSHADAGADVVAPSGMIDGMVGAIRTALDADGFERVAILSYAVKYASAFYGPFREAAEGAPQFGDRKSHQMDPGNAREALREAGLDVEQGADGLMVKPALGYLDVVRAVRERFPELPLAAYNVSGEYAMLKAAAANGWLDGRAAALEVLTGIRRAGADLVITYHAKEAASWLHGNA